MLPLCLMLLLLIQTWQDTVCCLVLGENKIQIMNNKKQQDKEVSIPEYAHLHNYNKAPWNQNKTIYIYCTQLALTLYTYSKCPCVWFSFLFLIFFTTSFILFNLSLKWDNKATVFSCCQQTAFSLCSSLCLLLWQTRGDDVLECKHNNKDYYW